MYGRQVNELFASLDIGTSTIHTVIGRFNAHGWMQIEGIGQSKSKGWRMGEVVDEESAVSSVCKAIEDAEHKAGCRIPPVVLGLSGECIHKNLVTPEAMHKYPIQLLVDPNNGHKKYQIIHLHNQNGAGGTRSKTMIVAIANNEFEACMRCLFKARVKLQAIYWAPMALRQSLIETENAQMDFMLIDIGGTHTNAVLYRHGKLYDAYTVNMGGHDITNDISVAFGTSVRDAEYLKRNFGVATVGASLGYQQIALPFRLHSRYNIEVIYHIELAQVIERRFTMIFSLLQQQVERDNPDFLPDCAFLSGGGSALQGIDSVATRILETESHLMTPVQTTGVQDPIMALRLTTSVGLMRLHAAQEIPGYNPLATSGNGAPSSFFSRLKQMVIKKQMNSTSGDFSEETLFHF